MAEKAYCVKCGEKVKVKNAKETTTKNDRDMIKGECPNCGTTVNKFV